MSSHVCPHDTGKGSTNSVPFDPNPRVFAASFSGNSGHDFSAVAGLQSSRSSDACSEPPDLDIVSGFAFLSFDSLDALELHINVNEANTSSLSVHVGQKRPRDSCTGSFEESSRVDTPAKKVRKRPSIPKPKLKKSKPKQGLQQVCAPDGDIPARPLQNDNNSPNTGPLEAGEWEEISLMCPETIPEDEIREVEIRPLSGVFSTAPNVCKQLGAPTGAALLPKKRKKKKKKKKKKEISCDQTSQTMFRIKKKNKNLCTKSLAKENQFQENASASGLTSGECFPGSVNFGGIAGLHIDDISNSDEQLKDASAESYWQGENASGCDKWSSGSDIPIGGEDQDVELPEGYHRSARPRRIEKIDWCARSGGVFSLNKYRMMKTRYHPMSLSLEERYGIEHAQGMLESVLTTPEGSDLDIDIRAERLAGVVKLEETTPSETSSDGLPKEYLFSNETFVMKRENDTAEMEVDVESVDRSVSKNFIVVSGIKETAISPAGHFSFHPQLTRVGTVDSSIQTYAYDIEVYVKCAMLQQGEIIKVIAPDNDDFEGKYLRNPDGLKAVRSLTERKRRNFLGELFMNLKMEVFTDLIDKQLYFSKQTILTKASATVVELVKQNKELSLRKAQLKEQSRELRKKLNCLIFGESASADQVINVEKLGNVLKSFNIEVEEPVGDPVTPSDSHLMQALTTSTTTATQTPSSVYNDKERGYYAVVKTTTVASTRGISTATASKPSSVVENAIFTSSTSVPTAPRLVSQVARDGKSSQISCAPTMLRHNPCQVSNPSSKIICNLSRLNTQRSTGNSNNISLVTNVNPAMKSLESKNVVHIKITNDVLKQIDETGELSPGEKEKPKTVPGNSAGARPVTCKPQIMLGTLIAKKVVPPTKKVVEVPPRLEPSTPQVRAHQSSGRHLRPILPHPPVSTEGLAGISKIVNTVNSPSILQHLALPQQSGSSTPIMFPSVQATGAQDINKPIIQGQQLYCDPQPATGIDGLQSVVDKLSHEQQSLAINRKIILPVKVPQTDVILLPSGTALSVLPNPVKRTSIGNMSSTISRLPSSFQPAVIGGNQLDMARSAALGVSMPSTISHLPSSFQPAVIGSTNLDTARSAALGGSMPSTVSRLPSSFQPAVIGSTNLDRARSAALGSSMPSTVGRLPSSLQPAVIGSTQPDTARSAALVVSMPISTIGHLPSSLQPAVIGSTNLDTARSAALGVSMPSTVGRLPSSLQPAVIGSTNLDMARSHALGFSFPSTISHLPSSFQPAVIGSTQPDTARSPGLGISLPSTISQLPSSFQPAVTGGTKLHMARSPGLGGSMPTTSSSLLSIQSAGSTHGNSSGLQLPCGGASGITATSVKASRGNSFTQLPQSNVSASTLSTSSHTASVSPRISAVLSTTSSLAPKTTAQTLHGVKTPLSPTEYVPMSSSLTVHSVPASTPGRVLSGSSQTAAKVFQKKVVMSQMVSTQGSQHVCTAVSTATPVIVSVATVSGAPAQHRQTTIKLPLSNIQSLTSFTGASDINTNTQVSTASTSTVHYSLPYPKGRQFLSVSSTTAVHVNSGVPVAAMCKPKVIQLPQSPVQGTLQIHPESAAQPNIPVHMATVTDAKPWIPTRQVSTVMEQPQVACDPLSQLHGQGSPSAQSSNSSKMFPEISENSASPLDIPQAPLREMRESESSFHPVLPPSEAAADIVWPQVPECGTSTFPASHYTIPAVGGADSLAQAEESVNIPSAFVTHIPVTDWRDSVDIPYLLSDDSVDPDETENSPSTETTVGQIPTIQCEARDNTRLAEIHPDMAHSE